MMTVLTLINLCILLHTNPYTEKSLYRIELFNEGIALGFFATLQVFPVVDFLGAISAYKIGWMPTSILIMYILVHIALNTIGSIN
jgi:hypothetical protein